MTLYLDMLDYLISIEGNIIPSYFFAKASYRKTNQLTKGIFYTSGSCFDRMQP